MVTLTPRQTGVLEFLSRGHDDMACARLLGMSRNTVRWHRTHILARLGARNTAHAVHIALTHRIIWP